jgi:hypothetical protein
MFFPATNLGRRETRQNVRPERMADEDWGVNALVSMSLNNEGIR